MAVTSWVQRHRIAPFFAWLICGVLLGAVTTVHAASYVYDANGRLRAVTSSTGDSSEYIYDALGNLYAIDSVPASQLAIFGSGSV